MEKNSPYFSYKEALQKMLKYCIYQDRCHFEVEKKLNEFRLIPEAREKIILYLIEENFLNETRFAQSFSRGKFRMKHWGKIRIKKELKIRNISMYNIKKGLAEIEEEAYINSFEKLSQKKWEALEHEPILKAKQKFINYFTYRGWESYLIFEKLNELINI